MCLPILRARNTGVPAPRRGATSRAGDSCRRHRPARCRRHRRETRSSLRRSLARAAESRVRCVERPGPDRDQRHRQHEGRHRRRVPGSSRHRLLLGHGRARGISACPLFADVPRLFITRVRPTRRPTADRRPSQLALAVRSTRRLSPVCRHRERSASRRRSKTCRCRPGGPRPGSRRSSGRNGRRWPACPRRERREFHRGAIPASNAQRGLLIHGLIRVRMRVHEDVRIGLEEVATPPEESAVIVCETRTRSAPSGDLLRRRT